MWFVFLISCLIFAIIALIIVWIGSKIFRSIDRQDKKDDLEDDQDTKNQVGYMNYQQIFGITKTKDKINHLIEKIKPM